MKARANVLAIAMSASIVITADVQPVAAGSALEIVHADSQPSVEGAGENFTGRVRIDAAFERTAPARVAGSTVTFEPGARTAWHTHPLGQTLIVTSGIGWVQQWGQPARTIRPGDVVWIPAGVKHWHGATATTAMTHIAITEGANGKLVDWMEKVSDGQYPGQRP